MILGAPSSAHVLHHLPIPPLLGPGHHRRRLLSTAHAARRDDAITEPPPAAGGAEREATSPLDSESLRVMTTKAAAPVPAAGFPSSKQDYSHTLFQSECVEVLGLVDLESLRTRPRLTVGVTVKASVVLPVMVVLAVLYLTDMAKGAVVDWTAHQHHHEREDVGD